MKVKKVLRKLILFLAIVALLLAALACLVSQRVVKAEAPDLVYVMNEPDHEIPPEASEAMEELEPQCIIVLGCGIKDRETPSALLRDRLDAGIRLYKEGFAPKLLLSGDNGSEGHNEIHVMLHYCLDAGVPAGDIFCDHAGFSTAETMLRARDIFLVERAIVVTQSYHEYRALYNAETSGIEALGFASDQDRYSGQTLRDLREVLARNKDFFRVMLGIEKALGGEEIPIDGDGTVSHGE